MSITKTAKTALCPKCGHKALLLCEMFLCKQPYLQKCDNSGHKAVLLGKWGRVGGHKADQIWFRSSLDKSK